jgi:hypothetical protein
MVILISIFWIIRASGELIAFVKGKDFSDKASSLAVSALYFWFGIWMLTNLL